MKANELMVGDWVMETNHGQMGKVTYIDANPDCNRIDIQRKDGGGFPCANDIIIPIPLTEDMLKKNGIKYQFGVIWYQLHNDSIQIVCNKDNAQMRLCVQYVHQLQHALRLCRLNFMADNFLI